MVEVGVSRGSTSSRRFWILTTWAGIAILAGVVTGILGFSRLATSGLAPAFGETLLYLFLGTQVILVGVVLYMYSLFESQKVPSDRIERFVRDYVQRLPEADPRRRDLMDWKASRWRYLTPTLVIGQTLAILALLAGLSAEYQSNAYMQAWVGRNFPLLGMVLHPYFVALLSGIFIGAVLIFFLQKRSREERLLEYLRRLE
jgi:hypothetical protein